jgi:hypothetical protein
MRQNQDLAESLKEGSSFVFKVCSAMVYFQVLTVGIRTEQQRQGYTRPSYSKMGSMSCGLQTKVTKALSTISFSTLYLSRLLRSRLQL